MTKRATPTLAPSYRLALIVGGLCVLFAGFTSAASLRQNIIVQGDQIVLGDLFEGLDAALADKKVSIAPAPGRRIVFDTRTLDRIARSNKIDWQPTSTLDTATIERAAQTITTEQILDRLRQDTAKIGGYDKVAITLDNQSLTVLLPTSVPASFTISSLAIDPTSRRLTATLTAPAEGAAIVETTLSGRATPLVDVAVLTEGHRNNQLIKADEVTIIQVPIDRVTPEIITKSEELVGKATKRGINAKALVKTTDVQMPVLIKRNEAVIISMRQGTMSLTVKGRAMEDGAKGDVIRVLNISSNRVLSANVDGPGRVTIDPDSAAEMPLSIKEGPRP
jgi:flagella basal body P-ring formation protein FlgA